MKTKQMIAAVAVLFAAGSAMAATDAYVDYSDFKSTRTRAEVRAELEQAYKENQIAARENIEGVEQPVLASRQQVRHDTTYAAKQINQVSAGGN